MASPQRQDGGAGATLAASDSVVLVTGGTGLVGHGLREVLEAAGAGAGDAGDPLASLLARAAGWRWVWLSRKDGDLRDAAACRAIFEKYRPRFVVHLAATVGGLYANMAKKLEFYLENCALNENVLRCCMEFDVQKCISCLSTCVFPAQIAYPVDETQVHDGPPHPSLEGYAYAKRNCEILSRLMNERLGCVRFVTLIPSNIFGKYDNFHLEDSHVIPGLIHKCYLAKQGGSPFVVFGSGAPLRQFLYAPDVGRIIVWMLEGYNAETLPLVVSNDEVTIAEAATAIKDAMGLEGDLAFDTSKADGVLRKTASNARLKTFLPDFRFTPFRDAIGETVTWFVDNFETARK